jgi:hypothetical protein
VAALQRRDPGGVVAAIFEPLQRIDELRAPAHAREFRQCRTYRPGCDIGTVADLDGGDERRIRTDEGAGADLGLVLAESVIVAGDGASADIGSGAYMGVANVSEMGRFGVVTELSGFRFHEIADPRARSKLRARTQPRERADRCTRTDRRSFKMGKRANDRALLHNDSGPENDIRVDDHVAAKFCIGCEMHCFGRHQCRTGFHRRLSQPRLHAGLGDRQLALIVYTHHFLLAGLAHDDF